MPVDLHSSISSNAPYRAFPWYGVLLHVLPCTMSWDSLLTTSNMKHAAVCTSTYTYVHVHSGPWNGIWTVCTSMYKYVQVCTSMYLYNLLCTSMHWYMTILSLQKRLYTSTYSYIRVQTVCSRSKKVQTGLEPAIFCMLLAKRTPTLREYRPHHRIYALLSSMYIFLAIAICLCTWWLV
jgi:hypothetical protein